MTATVTTELSRAECVRLLATKHLGQLALTRAALPIVVPVHYFVDRDDVLIHFEPVGGRTHSVRGEIVALHVCDIDSDEHGGWSVCVTGRAHVADVALHEGAPHASWVAGDGQLVALSLDLVHGDRLGDPAAS